MTLARDPLTFQAALHRISAHIGVPAMARVASVSQRLVYKWMHPTASAYPTILQAARLDAAFADAGHSGAPLFETYAQLLDAGAGKGVACTFALQAELAAAARECGEAIAHGLAVAQPDSRPRTVRRALGEAEQAQSAMAVVIRRLTSFLKPGMGPGKEATGGAQ